LITISVILDSISRNRKISVPVRVFKVSPFSLHCIWNEFFHPGDQDWNIHLYAESSNFSDDNAFVKAGDEVGQQTLFIADYITNVQKVGDYSLIHLWENFQFDSAKYRFSYISPCSKTEPIRYVSYRSDS
jgi:hypothetical protein